MRFILSIFILMNFFACELVNEQIKKNPDLKKKVQEVYEENKGELEKKKEELENKKAMVKKNKRNLLEIKPELIKHGLVKTLIELKANQEIKIETIKQYIFKTDTLLDTKTKIIYMDRENMVVTGIDLASQKTIYFVIQKELKREAKKEYKKNGAIVPGTYEIFDKKVFDKPQIKFYTKEEELFFLRMVYL